jgi:hypothetical protein
MAEEMRDRQMRKAIYWARAPFGRIGEALGFRWIMPIGTIPLPFHPAIAQLLPLVVPALVLHRILTVIQGEAAGVTWRGLLVGAVLAAVPMAIPIVQWLALAFRLPLLQSLLIAGAMILLALDPITGALPAWAGILPAAWIALFLVQRIGGPVSLRRLQARNAAFEPVVAGGRLVVLECQAASQDLAGWLSRNADLARVAAKSAEGHPSRLGDRTYYRLAPADLDRIGRRVAEVRPADWQVGDKGVVAPGVAADPEPGVTSGESSADPPIRVSARRHRSPFWLLAGERTEIVLRDGDRVQHLVGGTAAFVAALPLFACFYYLNIFPGPRSHWVGGFIRDKAVKLGPADARELLLQALPPAGEQAEFADPAPLLARLDAIAAEDLAHAREILDSLLDPEARIPVDTSELTRHPQVAFGRGLELCAVLADAKAKEEERAVRLAARLIASLPDAEFRSLAPELLVLLNSKALAFRLLDEEMSIGLPEREKRAHVVGGFSLIKWVPELYERLGDLGEPARKLIFGLGEMGRWPRALVEARRRLEEKA